MLSSERTEVIWELLFELVPTTGEVRILIEMRSQGYVVLLPDVASPRVSLAVRRMITQWFHLFFRALVYHDCVHVAAGCCHSHFLERVLACIRTVFASQDARERWIWLVRWRLGTIDFWVLCRSLPSMRTARSAERLPLTAMVASESAEVIGEFPFQFRPTRREIRVLDAMWFIRDVICLPDICRPGICPTIGWVVAQRLHSLFSALLNIRGIIVSVGDLHPDALELVCASVSPISAFQPALKWLIRPVWWSVNTHNVPGPVVDRVPTVGIAIRTKCLVLSAMLGSERTEVIWELLFELVPTTGEVRILIEMRSESYVVLLPDVACPRVSFAV
jgi:hypothetical protein